MKSSSRASLWTIMCIIFAVTSKLRGDESAFDLWMLGTIIMVAASLICEAIEKLKKE